MLYRCTCRCDGVLLSVVICQVEPTCPDFEAVYKSIEQGLVIQLSSVKLTFHRHAILYLDTFIRGLLIRYIFSLKYTISKKIKYLTSIFMTGVMSKHIHAYELIMLWPYICSTQYITALFHPPSTQASAMESSMQRSTSTILSATDTPDPHQPQPPSFLDQLTAQDQGRLPYHLTVMCRVINIDCLVVEFRHSYNKIFKLLK